ncbi:hypothetical protein J3F84DRAFT_376148 [Trichoderma pleuroticola]
MSSTPLYPQPQHDLIDLLQEGTHIKQYASTVAIDYTERLFSSSEDFSQPALRAEGYAPSLTIDECAVSNLMANDDEVIAQEDAFKEAMRLYESTADVKYRTGINPDDEHTVAQLESLVNESISQYQANDSRGFWGKISLACRKLGENKDNIEGWLGVLPSENQYLSVVCGGLKLILKLNEIREMVLESLERIPTLINNVQRVSSIYKESDKLRLLGNAFYSSILAALGHILKYLKDQAKVRRRAKEVLKAMVLPSSFDKELRGKIKKIEQCVGAFQTEANICQKEQLDQARQTMDVTMSSINEVKLTMVHAAAGQQETNRDMMETMLGIKRRQSDLVRDFSTLKSTLMEQTMRLLQSGDAVQVFAQMMMRQMDSPTSSVQPLIKTEQEVGAIRFTTRQTVQPVKAIHDQILSQLDLDQKAVGLDLTLVYNLGPKLSRDNQERSMFLVKAPELTAWMESEKSAVLLVNGNTKRVERRSGLTFVCARLVFAFEGITSSAEPTGTDGLRILPLYFFCGEHSSGDYSWETPKGVLDSIFGQLLTHMKRNGLSIDSAKVNIGNMNRKKIMSVFQRFERVLKQLPANIIVFCIIDSLSVYLDNDRTSDNAEQLIQQLLKLTQPKKYKDQCVFKLLLTAPKRFHSTAVDVLSEENMLTLPPTLPNKGGFTATKWHYSISQQLESFKSEG